MMFPSTTALYAALLSIVYLILTAHTIRLRHTKWVPLGDGGHDELTRATRAHANFAEYVPLFLVLLMLVEWSGFSPVWVHVLGLMVLLGRCLHAFGITQTKEKFLYRIMGMSLTLTAMTACALVILIQALIQ